MQVQVTDILSDHFICILTKEDKTVLTQEILLFALPLTSADFHTITLLE